ncbi:PHB depolymerase family esterase [Trebonia sp.]|uniref:extracellular catalytic domain type 1 short-chain-length polyhydroxyalkanoate depolymerase n=1 Tax=Trebonia sp. TaxID=2767075 RepID=UPI0026233122|nr:PHB depolymerase family esterase [Trebonia sp.]
MSRPVIVKVNAAVRRRPPVPALVVAVALTALISGCGGARHQSGAQPAAAGTLAAATGTTSGCGQKAAPGSVRYAVRAGGRSRLVIVHVPTGYTGSAPVALVLNLQGSQSTASAQEVFSGMDATSDADGFIVAYPQALIPDGTGYDWNVPGEPLVSGRYPPAGSADDVTFLTGLVRDLQARYCIDARRVYATGMSGGARMASQLACDASQVFAAVAPVAGLRSPSPCPAARPVPVIAFHGTADPVDPFTGHGLPYWTYSVPDAARMWAARDGCQSASPRTVTGAGYTLTQYAGCGGGAAVELYAIDGEGHEWPGGPAMPRAITAALGPQSDAIDANAVMWAFFQAHPLPA